MSLQDDQLIEVPEDDPDPVVPVAIGEVVHGKYRIGRIIGFGGMATVASGHHLELDQPVAIKFLRADQTARPDAVRRFLSEARAAAKLDSPHVARVLDVGSAELASGGVVPFMVMELLEGRDLDALLTERGRLPVDEAVEYILQACAGVAEAHAKGIIHRDLKPGNLFLTRRRDGTPLVKLLDFGISKTVSRTGKRATELTGDSELMGSPRYMSPEQTRSAKDVDARSDIWALGIILYELLAGVPPFDNENVADTLVSILQTEAKPIATLAPDVPPGLALIITRCLQKKAAERYASVEELAAALAPWRSATPVVIPPMIVRHDDLPSSEAGVSVQTVRAAMPRSRVLVSALVAAAAIAIVVVGVLVLGRLRARAAVASETAALAATSAIAPPPSAEEPAPVLAPSAAAAAPAPVESAAAATGPNAADAVPNLPKNVRSGGPRTKAPRGAGSAPRSRTDW